MTDRGAFDGAALVDALVDAEVRFVVIGGLAVIAHGYARVTDDLDIVPAPDEQNLSRLADLLQDLDYRIHGTNEFDPEELVHPDLEGLLAGGSWVLNTKYGGLDILQLVEPNLDFAELDTQGTWESLFGHQVRFCGYGHLIAMKEHASRSQDIADLERLRAIREDG